MVLGMGFFLGRVVRVIRVSQSELSSQGRVICSKEGYCTLPYSLTRPSSPHLLPVFVFALFVL